MSRLSGITGWVYVDNNSSPENPVSNEWLGAKSYTLNVEANLPDTTGFPVTPRGDAWRETIDGLKNYSGTVNAVYETDLVELHIESGNPPVLSIGQTIRLQLGLNYYYTEPPPNDPAYYWGFDFVANITSFSYNVAVDGAVEYTINFTGSGYLNTTVYKPFVP